MFNTSPGRRVMLRQLDFPELVFEEKPLGLIRNHLDHVRFCLFAAATKGKLSTAPTLARHVPVIFHVFASENHIVYAASRVQHQHLQPSFRERLKLRSVPTPLSSSSLSFHVKGETVRQRASRSLEITQQVSQRCPKGHIISALKLSSSD